MRAGKLKMVIAIESYGRMEYLFTSLTQCIPMVVYTCHYSYLATDVGEDKGAPNGFQSISSVCSQAQHIPVNNKVGKGGG